MECEKPVQSALASLLDVFFTAEISLHSEHGEYFKRLTNHVGTCEELSNVSLMCAYPSRPSGI